MADYVRDPNLPLSPVSLPLKRPATPKATATPKRIIVELDVDELGTGRSPARRLFDATPKASRRASKLSENAAGGDGVASSSGSGGFASAASSAGAAGPAGGNGSVGVLAPSPPMGSRRGSSALPTPSSSTSSSTSSLSSTANSIGRIHDPGFVIFSDEDVCARPVAQATVAVEGGDEENVPPEIEVEATPRRKRFEPSKLSTVTTSSSTIAEEARSGKQGMIDEADQA